VTTRFDSTAACAPAQHLRYPDYPIEQLARSKSTRFQMGFARMTVHLLPGLKDVVLEPTEDGLRILGATEMAFGRPEEVIRQMHGDDVQISGLEVRLIYGQPVQEPVMWVRAAVPRRYTEPALHDLIIRSARIEEVDWLAPAPLIRANAPLRRLLGFPKALAEISDGKAELLMGLSHYAPVPPEPGKAA
jgi:hypothetical protein